MNQTHETPTAVTPPMRGDYVGAPIDRNGLCDHRRSVVLSFQRAYDVLEDVRTRTATGVRPYDLLYDGNRARRVTAGLLRLLAPPFLSAGDDWRTHSNRSREPGGRSSPPRRIRP